MAYRVEQKIGRHIYLYEARSYWDPEKKQSRQKRKYLGKKDPQTGQPLAPRKGHTPRLVKDYGHVYLLQQVASRIGLRRILQRVFPEDYATLLALAYFEISEAAPLYLFPEWLTSSCLDGVQLRRAKDLTAFTHHVGRMERERLAFARQWVDTLGAVQAVVFDITSLSSYAEGIEYVEWGYNRDAESLPQVNLGVMYAEATNLPLHYQMYPGSIPDVSTLKNILKYLDLFALEEIVFVLDRGFYSAANVSHLDGAQMKFILPMPMSVKLFSSLRANNKRDLSTPAHAFVFHDEVLFHARESIELNHVELQAHLYCNEQSRSNNTTRFLKKILELESTVQKQAFRSKKDVIQYLSTHAKGALKFFHIHVKQGQVDLTRKARTLSRSMANMGTTIMLTNNDELTPEKVLDLYRRKDDLEKIFDVLKNEFDGKRLRGHSKEAIEGRMFIKFISLIIYTAIGNIMKKEDLFKKYTIREIMYELKKLKMVEMTNGKSYLTEVSKRQRDLFKKFAIDIPVHPS